MNNRFWTANAIPEEILDWVSENVAAAIKYYWEDDKPVGWIEVKDGEIFLKIGGPNKPTEDDPAGEKDIYVETFNLLEELTAYRDDHRYDNYECITALRKLAEDIINLADSVSESS